MFCFGSKKAQYKGSTQLQVRSACRNHSLGPWTLLKEGAGARVHISSSKSVELFCSDGSKPRGGAQNPEQDSSHWLVTDGSEFGAKGYHPGNAKSGTRNSRAVANLPSLVLSRSFTVLIGPLGRTSYPSHITTKQNKTYSFPSVSNILSKFRRGGNLPLCRLPKLSSCFSCFLGTRGGRRVLLASFLSSREKISQLVGGEVVE